RATMRRPSLGVNRAVPAVPTAAEIATGLELEMTAPLRAASSDFLVEHQRCADGGFRRDNRCAHARGSRDPARLQRRTQPGAVAHTKLYGGKPGSTGNTGRVGPEMAAEGSRVHHPDVAARR